MLQEANGALEALLGAWKKYLSPKTEKKPRSEQGSGGIDENTWFSRPGQGTHHGTESRWKIPTLSLTRCGTALKFARWTTKTSLTCSLDLVLSGGLQKKEVRALEEEPL